MYYVCFIDVGRLQPFLFADYSSEDEESVYETLSDSASVSVSGQVSVQQEDSNLARIAVAAGNSIKKLRRNWSLKKEDLTKGLSKIKRNSKSLIEDVYTKEGGCLVATFPFE